jgi:multiple sugar transport system substrate-binding protein
MKISFLVLTLVILLASCSSPVTPLPTATETTDVNPTRTATPGSPTVTTAPLRTPTPATHPDLDVPLEDLSGLHLLFWHPWTGEMAETINTIIAEFNQTNLWGVQVFASPAGGSGALVNLLETNLEEGPLPHVLVAPSEQILQWQEQTELFTELDSYIQDAQWGLTAQEQSAIPGLYWQQDALDGIQIGMPALRDMRVIFYNQSWARELGFPTDPQTFDEFSEQICEAADTRKNIDETGGWIIDTDPLTALSWILSADPPQIYDPQADIYQFDSQTSSAMLSHLRALFDDGCAWNSRLPDPYDYFANRQTLSYTSSLADIPIQSQWMQRRANPDRWTILPFPVDEGKPVVVVSGSAYAILNATPAEQLASWLFVRWLMLPRHQAQLVRASGLLPPSISTVDLLQDYAQTYPQWQIALAWVPLAQPVPQGGSWTVVQTILEDAAWQTFQPFLAPEDIPTILEQVDQLIPEVIAMEN